jgi:hypothetical protein
MRWDAVIASSLWWLRRRIARKERISPAAVVRDVGPPLPPYFVGTLQARLLHVSNAVSLVDNDDIVCQFPRMVTPLRPVYDTGPRLRFQKE